MDNPEIPETRYAKTADEVHIAYQVFGDGPNDLLFCPSFVFSVEAVWRWPAAWADLFRRLATFSRVILFDRRGTGLSDRIVVDSTSVAASLGDRAWKELLDRHHASVRSMLARYRGEEVDTAGDGFFAAFEGPARAVRCARAIVEAVRAYGIEIRAGVHTGEVETIDAKIGGLAVTIGARVGATAGASEVLVSSTVKDLTAGSGLTFEDAGEHELKGVPDRWHLYRAVP